MLSYSTNYRIDAIHIYLYLLVQDFENVTQTIHKNFLNPVRINCFQVTAKIYQIFLISTNNSTYLILNFNYLTSKEIMVMPQTFHDIFI